MVMVRVVLVTAGSKQVVVRMVLVTGGRGVTVAVTGWCRRAGRRTSGSSCAL